MKTSADQLECTGQTRQARSKQIHNLQETVVIQPRLGLGACVTSRDNGY